MDSSILYNLPEEVVIMIFEYLDMNSLRRLAMTCRQFNYIIRNEDTVWRGPSLKVLGSNQASPVFQKRCKPILPFRERCRTSKKWLKSLGDATKIAHFKKCMPWMVLEKDCLYLSKGENIVKYKRAGNGNVILQPVAQALPCRDDIFKFTTTENEVICAGSDGILSRLDKQNLSNIVSIVGHATDILAVDAKNDIIVSGCFVLNVWKAYPTKTLCKGQLNLENRVLSNAIMPNDTCLIGTPGTKGTPPLQLFDIERCCHLTNFGSNHRNGAGIVDIYPECYHTAFTCGYDSTLQLWDTRCSERSVAIWSDPFDSSLYCVQSDHNVTMITGAANHACCMLWDKRVLQVPVRTYHTPLLERRSGRRGRSGSTGYYKGPIYSTAFDATHLFIALERDLLQYSYM